MKMKVTCLNPIHIGNNRQEIVFGFSGNGQEIFVDADTFGEASDKASALGYVPEMVHSPTGNFCTTCKTDSIFIKVLPSSQWPQEIASAS